VTSLSGMFKGRAWVVLLATLLGVALTARLGVWQLDRAAQKQALQQALDDRSRLPLIAERDAARNVREADAQHYRKIRLRGHWVAPATVFLDNRQMNGRPGFYVVTPFKLDNGSAREAVLVQRGWVPRDQLDRARLPAVPTPAGEIEIAGHIAPPPARLYDFGGQASGPIRQNLDLDALAVETGWQLLPWSLVQEDSAGAAFAQDGLLREWPRPAIDIHKHYGYAFQWFALCALMAGLYVWFQLIRPQRRT